MAEIFREHSDSLAKDASIICLINGVNIPSFPINDSPDFSLAIASVSNSLLSIACFIVNS
jgi:hypothetical protein